MQWTRHAAQTAKVCVLACTSPVGAALGECALCLRAVGKVAAEVSAGSGWMQRALHKCSTQQVLSAQVTRGKRMRAQPLLLDRARVHCDIRLPAQLWALAQGVRCMCMRKATTCAALLLPAVDIVPPLLPAVLWCCSAAGRRAACRCQFTGSMHWQQHQHWSMAF